MILVVKRFVSILVALLMVAFASVPVFAATLPTASAPKTESVLLFHENSTSLLYGTAVTYTDSVDVIHIGTTLSSFVLPSAPVNPFGTTVIGVHALTVALAKANAETSLNIPTDAATTGFENITFRAALGNRWFTWRVGDTFVLTDKGKISLSGGQMATPAGDPGIAMSAAFPLREVMTLLGGKVLWSPDDGGIVQVELPTPASTTPPFYVP